MAVELYEQSTSQGIVHLKWMNYMASELYFNKAVTTKRMAKILKN